LLTPFNFLLGTLLVIIIAVGEFKTRFSASSSWPTPDRHRAGGALEAALDRLAVLNAPLAMVVRDGAEHEVPVKQLVLDELTVLRPATRSAWTARSSPGRGSEVDESLRPRPTRSTRRRRHRAVGRCGVRQRPHAGHRGQPPPSS
jgi:cation-transporting ATPase E